MWDSTHFLKNLARFTFDVDLILFTNPIYIKKNKYKKKKSDDIKHFKHIVRSKLKI